MTKFLTYDPLEPMWMFLQFTPFSGSVWKYRFPFTLNKAWQSYSLMKSQNKFLFSFCWYGVQSLPLHSFCWTITFLCLSFLIWKTDMTLLRREIWWGLRAMRITNCWAYIQVKSKDSKVFGIFSNDSTFVDSIPYELSIQAVQIFFYWVVPHFLINILELFILGR